jgi:hypothetical protein
VEESASVIARCLVARYGARTQERCDEVVGLLASLGEPSPSHKESLALWAAVAREVARRLGDGAAPLADAA